MIVNFIYFKDYLTFYFGKYTFFAEHIFYKISKTTEPV